ncbi:ferlin [Plasmodium gonderi]|uniref:Ferlin n=1 Tax=Plasmodium gonderi TaxID=77519 RepID=A0A1Y1JJU3_PLAGO|nr:ferlin [Plasmodium gonderi]GAW82530.1 ferlin [Plasmodium gonderi]
MRTISVGFTIYEAQNLEAEDKTLLDPLVVVRCCNQEYITKKKKKKYNAVNWEESHIWDRISLSEIEWNVAKIEFEVQSANTFWRNDIIGVISFELKLIKNKQNHEIYGTYPILYKNGTEIRGQLRLKVIVCDEKDYTANNDILNNLSERNNRSISYTGLGGYEDEDEDNFYTNLTKAVVEENPIMVRDAHCRYYYLYVNIHKIEDIYIDVNKKKLRDLYVTCEFNGCHLKSSQGRNCVNYTFNECFKIPIATPILEDSIVIKIWDWNFLSNDELLAVGVLSFNQIKNESLNPTWINLYGFHKNEMNFENDTNHFNNPDFSLSLEGNFYLGRICISSYVERINNFDNLNIAMTQSCLSFDDPLYIPVTLLCDIYLVTGILANNIYVQISCGPFRKQTDCVYVNEGEMYTIESRGAYKKGMRNVRNFTSITNGDYKKYELNSENYENVKNKQTNFANLFNFDDILNLDNFFTKVTEKQKIIEMYENTEFYFTSRNGKIENMKFCVVKDEMQQWDVLINVFERGSNYYNCNNNEYLDEHNGEGGTEEETKRLTDRQKYIMNKRKMKKGKRGKYAQKEASRGGRKEEEKDNVYNNDRRIAYYRIPLKNVLLYNEKLSRCPIWIPLKNIPQNVNGEFNCMYNIFQNGSILINLEKSYDVHLGINRRKNLIPVNYELRCYIYACRNVISHFNESPNTFVHISCSGKMKITSLVLSNSNPVFLQCLKLNVKILTDYSVGLPTIPLIVVTLYEFYNNTFYFIGRCFCNYDIYLRDNQKKYNFPDRGSKYNVVDQVKPRWIKLKGNKHVKAMYPKNLWQHHGNDKRVVQEYMYEKQRELRSNSVQGKRRNNSEYTYPHNDLLCNERVGDILLYFELVQEKDAIKFPTYPMITEIKKCTLSFFCMSLENLMLMKRKKQIELLKNESTRIVITHPIILLSITSYSSYGKKNNELVIKYEKSLKSNARIQLKNWKNSFDQQSFEMFCVKNLSLDLPLDPIFDPILNIKVYNKKIKEKYFIGETSISLVPYLPWIKDIDKVLYYLKAHDDYSETIDIENVDTAFNLYKNKHAALVITAISMADFDHAISLKEEVKRHELADDDEEWKNLPIFSQDHQSGAYGSDAYGNGAYGNDAYGNGAYGNGAYGNGAYGNGAYGNDAYGNDTYGSGAYGNGAYGNGAYGNGAYGNDTYGNDAYGSGAYGNGAYGSGAYGNGAYGNGAYGNGALLRDPKKDIYGDPNVNFQTVQNEALGYGHQTFQPNANQNNEVVMNMYKNNIQNPGMYGMINYGRGSNMEIFPKNGIQMNTSHEYNIMNDKLNSPFARRQYYTQMKRNKNTFKVKYENGIYKLHDDGVPEIIKASYNVKNYPYIKILTSKFILNVYIPPRFILYVEGDKINVGKRMKNFHRVSVDGVLESYLDDILIPSLPLKKKLNCIADSWQFGNVNENKITKEGMNFACYKKFPFMEILGGQIKCFTKIRYQNLESENIPLSLKDITNQNIFRNKFRGSKKIPLYLKIRVYVLRGIGICGINSNYMANPYLIFSLGEKTSNLRNSYKEHTLNPEFRCMWESEAIFPEDEILTVSLYSAEDNYDKRISDLYIGSTEINLFDRWTSKEWRRMMKRNKIPIEYRPLYINHLKSRKGEMAGANIDSEHSPVYYNNTTTTTSVYDKLSNWNSIFSFFDIFTYLITPSYFHLWGGVGVGGRRNYRNEEPFLANQERQNNGILEMWVEIMDYEQSKKTPIHKMETPKKTDIEIRIIIWRCTMLSVDENINKTFDLTVTSELDCVNYNGTNPAIQTTDVHYNCKNGNAVFNWRIVYPRISHPLNTCFLQLAAYNNNNVGVSEFLGEVNLELSKYINKASEIVNKLELDAELKLRKKNGMDSDNNYNGYLQVTVQFIPQIKANIKPVGLGRQEPNRNPYLRTPDSGRDWNDFVYSISFNDIYKPFWGWLKMFFICVLLIWVFIMSFVYPSLLI